MVTPIRHANPENVAADSRTFFITSSIADKRNLLQSDRSAQLFIRLLYEYRRQGKFRLHEFVVMPDHFHVLLTIDAGMTIERAVQFIKGGFSFRLRSKFEVWQCGFAKQRVEDARAYRSHVSYLHGNPVRARLCERAEEFSYSSASGVIAVDPAPEHLTARG